MTLLRAARIAHRDLRLANVMADDAGAAWLVDFGFAESAASDRRLAQDVAELLASSTVAVGADRAASAALAAVGTAGLTPAVPLLQPLALSSATRSALHGTDLLTAVRVAAADLSGIENPRLEPLERVQIRKVVALVCVLFAIHLLIPQIGELRLTLNAFRSVRPGYLVIAAVASAGTYLAAGLAMLGCTDRPLPYVRTTAVQLAGTFANRITPANLGGAGVNARYLQRGGVDRATAWAAIALNTTAGGIVHVIALLTAGIAVGRSGVDIKELPPRSAFLIGLLAILLIAGVVLWSPLGRGRLLPPIRQASRSVGAVLRRPSKAAQLFGGSAAVTTLYVAALYVSLRSVGASVSVLHVTAVYLGAAAVASVAPTPGGIGAMEAALIAGLAAFGAPSGPAVAGVLLYRLLTYWLPIVPGWIEFRRLQHLGVL